VFSNLALRRLRLSKSVGLETMKVIEHSVFEEPGAGYPIGLIFFPPLHDGAGMRV